MAYLLLVDPRARGAYFGDLTDVALAELRAVVPGVSAQVEQRSTLTFVRTDAGADCVPALARLSFVQGVLAESAESAETEVGLQVVDASPDFILPDDLVWGAKYRGKTHELVTQAALNIAIAECRVPADKKRAVLDPMAGRGTTLLWAARYGMTAWGIELEERALDDLHRHVKRQAKLHRIKHAADKGWVGRKRSDGVGAFVEYRFGEAVVRLVTGDSRHAADLLGGKRYAMLVTDLPYGIEHTGSSGKRNPLDTLRECAPAWAASLRPGGSMVLVFNRLQPRRDALAAVFADVGLEILPLEAPHRMSESIVRDFLVARRPLPTGPSRVA